MKGDIAAKYYHGPENYNCAQAVLSAFKQEAGITDGKIAAAKSDGGGRAKGGLCGAVYAMQHVLDNDKLFDSALSEFRSKAGALHCKELRRKGTFSCKDCVRLAAEICEKNTKNK